MSKTKERYDLIVVIPVGPNTNIEFLSDTIDSVKYYCSKKTKIILVNDSLRPLGKTLRHFDVEIIENEKILGKHSGLYFSLSRAYKFALDNYSFDVLLRMDDDALITGPFPEKDAKDFFEKNTDVGMLGSYLKNWNEEPRDFSYADKISGFETSILWSLIDKFGISKHGNILPILKQAVSNGYILGHHVQGGAYFLSFDNLNSMNSLAYLPTERFRGSRMEEDFIFSTLTYAVNKRLGDFVTGSNPMCIKWRGLPLSPDHIIKLEKKVVHSCRFYSDMNEVAIRKFFHDKRI